VRKADDLVEKSDDYMAEELVVMKAEQKDL
jgi:hypothetical protein